MENMKQEQESEWKTTSSPSSVLPRNRASEAEPTTSIAPSSSGSKEENRNLCLSSAIKMCEDIIRELGPVESKKLFQFMSKSDHNTPSVSNEAKTEETMATSPNARNNDLNKGQYSIRQELVRLFGQKKSTTGFDVNEDEISGRFQIYGRRYDGSFDSVMQSIMSYYEFNGCFPIGNRLKGFLKHWLKIDVSNNEVVNEIKVSAKESMRSILLFYFSLQGWREIDPITPTVSDQHMDGYFSN